jgi:ubiquinone/menaquinone biosynthesis C-methylase UbiE
MSSTTLVLRRSARASLLLALLATAARSQTPATAAAASGGANHMAARDTWQRPADIFAAVGAVPGARIADVGAGEGWLTTRLAKQVGPTGRVFAVDISESALQQLKRSVEAQALPNVELVLGEEDDPRLPYSTLDGIVVVNAYHEMARRVAMLESFKRALRIGGTLVIVDNAPTDSAAPRQRQMSSHQLGMAHAEDDLVAHGYEVVRREPDFIRSGSSRQWLLVARRVK